MGQKILNSIRQLQPLLAEKKTLLVCGRSFDKLPIARQVSECSAVRFSDFAPNPLYEDVCKGVDLFLDAGCEAILVVGGGSAMDVAKCIKLFSGLVRSVNYLQQEFRDTGIPLIAIPTTAGTGSESTRHAVIYYKGEKQSISHYSIVPDYACLVPEVLKALPLYQKKCTLLDALCQAIESWWSVNSTCESREYSRRAIELIRDNWHEYIAHNGALNEILLAANLSGRAINITATTAPHAMSYKLTSLYGIPHGHAVALSLPLVWEHMLTHLEDCTDSRGTAYLAEMFTQIPVDAKWFRALLQELEMSRPESQDKARDLEVLTASVNPVRLKNNPVMLDANTLKALYERIVR